MKRIRILLLTLLVLMTAAPSWAVFYEKDMKTTLSILLQELKQTQEKFKRLNSTPRPTSSTRTNNKRMSIEELTEQCNAISLMLYSQSSYNFTFDLTYALDQVSKQYNEFHTKTQPFDRRLAMMRSGKDRYTRLVNTLVKMPDDPEYNAVRDSCVAIAEQMANFYTQGLGRLELENERYEELEQQLEDAYEYAQESYESVQQRIIYEMDCQLRVMLRQEVTEKYGGTDTSNLSSARIWSGSAVLLFGLMALIVLVGCFLLAWLISWLCYRFIPFLQKEFLQSRRRMITLLLGIVFFGVFSFVLGSHNNPYWMLISRLCDNIPGCWPLSSYRY